MTVLCIDVTIFIDGIRRENAKGIEKTLESTFWPSPKRHEKRWDVIWELVKGKDFRRSKATLGWFSCWGEGVTSWKFLPLIGWDKFHQQRLYLFTLSPEPLCSPGAWRLPGWGWPQSYQSQLVPGPVHKQKSLCQDSEGSGLGLQITKWLIEEEERGLSLCWLNEIRTKE